jgi:hypothetical protein
MSPSQEKEVGICPHFSFFPADFSSFQPLSLAIG